MHASLKFLTFLSLSSTVLASRTCKATNSSIPTILHNGNVFIAADGDAPDRFASAVVLDASTGKITHVGDETDDAVIKAKAAPGAVLHDVQGRVVLPGFVDGHTHLAQTGAGLEKLNIRASKNLGEIQAAIRAWAAQHPDLPRILCRGWFHPSTDGNELATQLDGLDADGKNRPVYIDAEDMHSAWLNTAALDELGVADRADPPGGRIRRGPDGKPSGVMEQTAASDIVWSFLASKQTAKEKQTHLQSGLDAYTTSGYTGAIDMAMGEEDWEAIQEYRQAHGELPIWLAAHWLIFPRASSEETLKQVDRAIELHKQYNKDTSPRCRIAGIKIITDGVVDACTAAMQQPYSHNNQSAAPIWTREALEPVLRRADAAGLQIAMHAIGDAAIKLAINGLEAVGNPAARHRIEHLETTAPEDVPRLGALGITASVQAVHLDPAGVTAWEKLLGKERNGHVFPYAAFAEHGAALALGTDSPTAPYNPLANLYVATTRRSALERNNTMQTTPQFALSLAAAVAAATRGSARSCFAEDKAGQLLPGWDADLVVVDMEWNAEMLLDAKVAETWIRGKRVYPGA
ncbi:amidohydrolase family protein [Cordyceps fumosorosea ARSEF 2679]|uniref:Amidohydrolase family protein n=1 Tax=Cordyceps fumosorosea (strain ARSEF 2679) TaxID=1081104 RepID=A0A167LYG7_CORFA|nr:amidohydrolase family protein [Cordyceps fumosorosea ARSEF 2679]OAA53684.1 amidohydrolase family protein [Cordyceps fumosorosea ARSEF 2679]